MKRGLDKKVMNFYLRVCLRVQSMSHTLLLIVLEEWSIVSSILSLYTLQRYQILLSMC